VKNKYEVRGDVTAIIISSSKHGLIECLISTDDLERVKEHSGTWRVSWNPSKKGLYVLGHTRKPDGNQTSVYLHRWILGLNDPKIFTDHVNGNTLDNTRSNLNEVTPAENQQNKGRLRNNTSGYTGITWHKQRGKWQANIEVNGSKKSLGLYNNINDAVAARKHAESQYYEYKTKIQKKDAM
jgi:hypothetical protein